MNAYIACFIIVQFTIDNDLSEKRIGNGHDIEIDQLLVAIIDIIARIVIDNNRSNLFDYQEE